MHNFISSKNVLVTGGAGYIGSIVCKLLFKGGYQPIVFDNLVHGHKEFVQWGPFEQGDILDKKRLLQVFDKYKPLSVFHFAGFGYVGESINNPRKYYQNNVIGTWLLLDVMLTVGATNLIFSSTCATYGVSEAMPIVENMAQNPINPYGQSKLCIEKMLQEYDHAYGIKSIILRYFNAAGADPEGDVGEDHDPEQHLIPLILDVALGKRKKITLFGADYATKDGTCIRDYVHVYDLATAHLNALEYILATGKSNHFNLGNGSGYSVKEVIAAVEGITRKKIIVEEVTKRAGDPAILVADTLKAKRELQWHPIYSDIDMIINHAWQWHTKRFNKVTLKKSCFSG